MQDSGDRIVHKLYQLLRAAGPLSEGAPLKSWCGALEVQPSLSPSSLLKMATSAHPFLRVLFACPSDLAMWGVRELVRAGCSAQGAAAVT